MVDWARKNRLHAMFLTTLVAGLLCLVGAFFLISPFWGLVAVGVSLVGGGHWVTYLRVSGGGK